MTKQEIFGYDTSSEYSKSVAYFSMEFAIDQSLKIYSGGLGFLAGSHLRSAYQLKQNLVGIGMLWKYGYYDQTRDNNALMKPEFTRKQYSFLKDTGILFTVPVNNSPVHVKAYLLKPETFGSAPLFLLSTDLPENDILARTITHSLYDSNEQTRIAQSIILGIGGAMLMDALEMTPDVYHMNEGHSVALNFYLHSKYKNLDEIRKRVAFTTHTPEMAGNEEHSYELLKSMSFFYHLQDHEVKSVLGLEGDNFNYTLASLKFAGRANGVSKLHAEVSRNMWGGNENICEIISITNAQNKAYWVDPLIEEALVSEDNEALVSRKKELKKELFKIVADQCGKLFDENVLTIVWARRFAEYKRADLVMHEWSAFIKLITNMEQPVQIIWAGKPYPKDTGAVDLFNQIIEKAKPLDNCAVLTGYELSLSASLKKGSDVWLNNPRMYREASGTSGMSAAMNGSINLSLPDGWVPEFAKDRENCFIVQPADQRLPSHDIDRLESAELVTMIQDLLIPMYYERPDEWLNIIKNAARDVVPEFESGRMAKEYYEKMYSIG